MARSDVVPGLSGSPGEVGGSVVDCWIATSVKVLTSGPGRVGPRCAGGVGDVAHVLPPLR